MDRLLVGVRGEEIAAEHLSSLGWQIIERRWRCAAGELDIVAIEPAERPVTVFCEVKCRTGLGYGGPLEAITLAKVAKLRELAAVWLQEHRPRTAVRFDGIGVLLRPGWSPIITHVRGIS